VEFLFSAVAETGDCQISNILLILGNKWSIDILTSDDELSYNFMEK